MAFRLTEAGVARDFACMSVTPAFQPKAFTPKMGEAPLSPIQEEILHIKKERNAVIPAHNYHDHVGDSLGLACAAAETNADVIVFCGVHFMAATAKIVNPTKTVLLPEHEAGCSLSDSLPAEQLAQYRRSTRTPSSSLHQLLDGGEGAHRRHLHVRQRQDHRGERWWATARTTRPTPSSS